MTPPAPFRGRASARPSFVGAVLVAAAGLAAGPPGAPRAAVRGERFDFGTVRRGEKIEHVFAVHNAGTARLTFTGANLSMPGMTCRISPPIPPGGDGSIAVEWKTDRVQGAVEGVAEIATNDPARPSLRLTLAGRIEGPLDIAPMPAVFLSTFRGEGIRRELSLRSHVGHSVGLSLVESPGAHYRATLDPAGPGTAWRLIVEAAPTAPTGRYEESLRLESRDPAIGSITIPVHLYVKPDLYANPDDLDFGRMRIAPLSNPAARRLAAQTFFVKKRTGTFRITGLRSDVPALDLRVDPPSGAAGSFQVDAGIRPDALVPRSLDGTITIETDDPAFPVLTVRVEGKLAE